VNPGDEPPTNDVTTDTEVLSLLEHGEIETLGAMPRASNGTFLARVRRGDEQVLAVYKPRRGEAPLWDFPDGTLANREAAAYVLASDLGWPRVPPTLLREGPWGPGAVQLFVPFDPNEHFFTLRETHAEEFQRVALFDAIANNADRKSGHCLLARDDGVFVIDHGVCFHEEPKLRTVIWDFMGEPIPQAMARDLRALSERLDGAAGAAPLRGLLGEAEFGAVRTRLAGLLDDGRFPEPGPMRPYPWPVV
jgi:uncharacterized repeat protein (TIGR03843 family)